MHKLFLRTLLNEADFLVFWLSSNDRRLDEKLIVFNAISVSFSATNRPKNMSAASAQKVTNETAHIRNIFMKATVLCCYRCLTNTGVEKMSNI